MLSMGRDYGSYARPVHVSPIILCLISPLTGWDPTVEEILSPEKRIPSTYVWVSNLKIVDICPIPFITARFQLKIVTTRSPNWWRLMHLYIPLGLVSLYESCLQLAILVLQPLGWLTFATEPFLLNLIGLSPFWWDFAELSPILRHSWCGARYCPFPLLY
jgi:hypothetical protein